MTELSSIPPAKADTTAQTTARYAAIGMAGIALVGFVAWTATSGSDVRSQSAASVSSAGALQNSLFREGDGGIYVALPPGADPAESRIGARRATEGPPKVAALLVPERKPLRASATAKRQAPDEATQAAADEPYEPVRNEPALSEPASAEPVRHESTLDEQIKDEPSPVEHADQAAWDEPESDEPTSDEQTWDDEQMADEDEPPADEPFDDEDRS